MKSLLAALLLLAAPAVHAQASGIAVGAKAPTAVVEALDGKAVDLGQYIGKVPVLIEFWATWCPNCKELEPALVGVQKKYGARLKVLGIAVSYNQSPERLKLYVQRHGLTHDVLFDRKGAASDAYAVPATSYIVVVDRTGKVVYTGVGGGQDLEAAVRKAM